MKLKIKIFFCSLLILVYSSFTVAEEISECNIQCTFVLLDGTSGEYTIKNKHRAKLRLPPFSTFKIPNTIIALDTGVVKDLDQLLSFDKDQYKIQNWWPKNWYEKPLNIKTAFANSAVPIYRNIATSVGEEKMKSYVTQFNYGNQDISSGLDSFWLNGSLKISAIEQVEFIQSLFKVTIDIDKNILTTLNFIMLTEETKEYKFYAKTGSGRLDDGMFLGWYVGAVESKNGTHFFALNIIGNTFNDIRLSRKALAKKLLKQAGII